MSVLGFASVLLPYSCSALHEYTRKRISFPAPKLANRYGCFDDGRSSEGPLQLFAITLFVYDAAVEYGPEDFGFADVVQRDFQQVSIEDDEVGVLACLD